MGGPACGYPNPVRCIRIGAFAAVSLVVASCSPGPAEPAPVDAPSFPIGQAGVPVHVTASSGASADIALGSASWFPPGCAGGFACNVVELTITGTSATPFRYSETYVTAGYGGGAHPWTHPDQTQRLGASTAVDYERINKLPPLRTGSVIAGQTAHGFVGFDMQGRGDLYLEFGDPDQGGTLTEAGWKVHT